MPLEGTYTWSETPNTVEIVIPLKGVSSKKLDVFLAETIVKVSYPPFLLDLNLLKSIEYNQGSANRKDGILHLELIKKELGLMWGTLIFVGSLVEIADRRAKAIQNRANLILEHHEAAKRKKWEEEKLGVRRQIQLESGERDLIEQLKSDEKEKEERNLFESMERLEMHKWSARDSIDKVIDDAVFPVRADDDSEKIFDNSKDAVGGPPTPTMCKSSTDIIIIKRLPQPRSRKVAKMSLTPRIFYTPMRESTKKMEQEFIIKNRHYLKSNQLLNRHALHQYDFVGCSPLWLKAKGDEFYRSRDFLSAINAYTHAFEQGSFVEGGGGEAAVIGIHVIANRAACHLQLGESQRCIQDCDFALNKVKNKEEREKYFIKEADALTFEHKLISRLCAAQCQLGNFHDALSILQQQAATMKRTPNDGIKELWHQDIKAITLWYESSLLKNKADMKLSEGSLEDAQELYTEALVLQPSMVSALANRSAFHMAKRNFSLCIQDCSAAAAIIDEEKNPKRNMPFPLFNSSKCLEWKVTITLRRCAAKEMTNDFKGALSDIESVVALLGCSSFRDSLENKRESLMKLQQVQ